MYMRMQMIDGEFYCSFCLCLTNFKVSCVHATAMYARAHACVHACVRACVRMCMRICAQDVIVNWKAVRVCTRRGVFDHAGVLGRSQTPNRRPLC